MRTSASRRPGARQRRTRPPRCRCHCRSPRRRSEARRLTPYHVQRKFRRALRKALEKTRGAERRQRSERAVSRKPSSISLLIGTLLSVCLFISQRTKAEIRYTVSLLHPEQHLFHVTVEVPDVKDRVEIQMAACDALYEIRDFSSHVQRVTATVNGKAAPIEKVDELTWRVQSYGTIEVSYA